MKDKYPDSVKCDVKIVSSDGSLNYESKGTNPEEEYKVVDGIISNCNNEELKTTWERIKNSFGFTGYSHGELKLSTSIYIPTIKGEEKHKCPRSGEATMGGQKELGENATWDKLGEDRVCSYCGSLHPDDLVELIKKHGSVIIEISTKSYKIYIANHRIPSRSYIHNAGLGAIKFYTYHLEDSHREAIKALDL